MAVKVHKYSFYTLVEVLNYVYVYKMRFYHTRIRELPNELVELELKYLTENLYRPTTTPPLLEIHRYRSDVSWNDDISMYSNLI